MGCVRNAAASAGATGSYSNGPTTRRRRSGIFSHGRHRCGLGAGHGDDVAQFPRYPVSATARSRDRVPVGWGRLCSMVANAGTVWRFHCPASQFSSFPLSNFQFSVFQFFSFVMSGRCVCVSPSPFLWLCSSSLSFFSVCTFLCLCVCGVVLVYTPGWSVGGVSVRVQLLCHSGLSLC